MNNRHRLLILVFLLAGPFLSCLSSSTQGPNPAGSSNPDVSPNPLGEIELLTVSPNQAFGGEETEVTLTGSGFDNNLKIKVGADEITGYTLVDSKTLQLKINPSSPGLLDIILTTLDGEEMTLKESLLIHPSRPVWRLETILSKKNGGEILSLLYNTSNGSLLASLSDKYQFVLDDRSMSIISLHEIFQSTQKAIYTFGGFSIDPPCAFDGSNDPCAGGGTYGADLKTIAVHGPSGDYFGVVSYKNIDEPFNVLPPEMFRLTPTYWGATWGSISPPSPLSSIPLFFSDINQQNVYAFDSVHLWQWNEETSGWISLLVLDNQPGLFVPNAPFIANADPGDSFLCLAYEEQNASCSRTGGSWKKISFLGVTAGKKITSFAYDTKNKILFAGEDSGKVLASRDFETWTLWGDGSLDDGFPDELFFNAEKEILLAVTTTGDMYSSFRGGEWILVTAGKVSSLFIRNLSHLIYDPIGKRFYAVVIYGGGPLETPDPSDPFPWYSIGSFSLSE